MIHKYFIPLTNFYDRMIKKLSCRHVIFESIVIRYLLGLMLLINTHIWGQINPELLVNIHSIDSTEMLAITPVETGVLCYNIDADALFVWEGSSWVKINQKENKWLLTGNSGINPNDEFLGTLDNLDLVFRTNNVERARFLANGRLGIGTLTPSNTVEINSNQTDKSGLTFTNMDNETEPSAGSPIGIDANGEVINNPLFRVQTKTANYTLQLSDHNSVIEFNSGSQVVCTIPASLPTGFQVSITQLGAGKVRFVGAAGVNVRNAYELDQTAKQYSKVGVEVASTGEVILSGDLSKS